MTSIRIHIIKLRRRLEFKCELDVMWCNCNLNQKNGLALFYMRCVITWYFYPRLTSLMRDTMTLTSQCNSTTLTKLVINGPLFIYLLCKCEIIIHILSLKLCLTWHEANNFTIDCVGVEARWYAIAWIFDLGEVCLYIFMAQSINPQCSNEACLSEPGHQYQVHSLKQSNLFIQFC